MLVRILNLPVGYRRLCAILFGLLMLATAAATILLPVQAFLAQQTELSERRSELGRYLQIVSASASPDTLDNLDGSSQLFMSGANQAVIAAELQSRFNTVAGQNAVTVLSVGSVPGFESDGVRFLGIKATLSGTVGGIHDTLFALENATPPVLVRRARFLVPRLRPASGVGEPKIQTQFTIFAAIDPEAGASPNG